MKVVYLSAALLRLLDLASAVPGRRYSWRDVSGATGYAQERSERRILKARDTCEVPVDIPVSAPKPNPFVALSQDEIDAVASWLLSPDQGLNLTNTSGPSISLSDNYIWHIDVLKPNKTDVLSYFDANGTIPRYARVALIQGGLDIPTVSEYSVSQNKTTPNLRGISSKVSRLVLFQFLKLRSCSHWTTSTMDLMGPVFLGMQVG